MSLKKGVIMRISLSWRMFPALIAAAIIAAFAILVAWGELDSKASGARLIHEEPSEFSPVVVYEAHGQRCFSFETLDQSGRQTCININDPDKLVFEYTRMMVSALFVLPRPQSILIVGLGGGTLPSALAKLLPNATIDSVEIDPAVVRVAQTYFGYTPGPKQRIFIEDGRQFIQNALHQGKEYDMVMLDAFDADYIPGHLLTVEFFQEIKKLLAKNGVVVANSFVGSRFYDEESATYASVFGSFFNVTSRIDGNRVIIAQKEGLISDEQLERNAHALAARLAPLGVDVQNALARYSRLDSAGIKAEPLRDADFAS